MTTRQLNGLSIMRNVDASVTEGFGREWSTFTQGESELEANERQRQFDQYFRIFPWDDLPANAEGLDAGCGTGRWATLVAQKVGRLHLLDASDGALSVARRNLANYKQECLVSSGERERDPPARS